MSGSNCQLDEARRLLDVARDADAESLRRAFKAAVKAAHPDRPGGNDERLRRVIEAYRQLDALALERPDATRLPITPAQAMLGGWSQLRFDDDRQLSVRLPAGLRDGEPVRVSGRGFRIAVDNGPAAAIVGDDLVITAPVARSLTLTGGRLTVDTPAGETSAWISKTEAALGSARLFGLGLPARGAYAAGDLVLRLKPEPDARFDTPAQAKRARFAAAWAA